MFNVLFDFNISRFSNIYIYYGVYINIYIYIPLYIMKYYLIYNLNKLPENVPVT